MLYNTLLLVCLRQLLYPVEPPSESHVPQELDNVVFPVALRTSQHQEPSRQLTTSTHLDLNMVCDTVHSDLLFRDTQGLCHIKTEGLQISLSLLEQGLFQVATAVSPLVYGHVVHTVATDKVRQILRRP